MKVPIVLEESQVLDIVTTVLKTDILKYVNQSRYDENYHEHLIKSFMEVLKFYSFTRDFKEFEKEINHILKENSSVSNKLRRENERLND